MIELIDVVDVVKATKDSWGINASSPSITTYDARVFYQYSAEELKLADGSTVTVTGKVFFAGAVHIESTDKIQYIDDFGIKRTYKVLGIKIIKDFAGVPLFTKVVI